MRRPGYDCAESRQFKGACWRSARKSPRGRGDASAIGGSTIGKWRTRLGAGGAMSGMTVNVKAATVEDPVRGVSRGRRG